MTSRVLGCEENLYLERSNSRPHPSIKPIRLKYIKFLTNHAVSNRTDLKERTKTASRHGDRRGQITDLRDSFETINWLFLLFKCGIKTKTHFEWHLWHWTSLVHLNLEPLRPNGLVDCKVPTDLVKISGKEATHMGFIIGRHRGNKWLHCVPVHCHRYAWAAMCWWSWFHYIYKKFLANWSCRWH